MHQVDGKRIVGHDAVQANGEYSETFFKRQEGTRWSQNFVFVSSFGNGIQRVIALLTESE